MALHHGWFAKNFPIFLGKHIRNTCIVSSPPKIRGVLVFKIWTKRGVIKKLLRNRMVNWKVEILLERGGPNCFISFPPEKHVFITVGILFFLFCLVIIHTCCNHRSTLSWGLLSTRKLYIMKFLFLLLLFLNIFCENFIINDVYFHFHLIKNFKFSWK